MFGNTDSDGAKASIKADISFNNTTVFLWAPILGFDYSYVNVSCYSESGDLLLTFNMGDQEFESLIGSISMRFWNDMKFGRTPNASVDRTHRKPGTSRRAPGGYLSPRQRPLLPFMVPVGSGRGSLTRLLAVSPLNSQLKCTSKEATASFGQDDCGLSVNIGLRSRF